MIFFNSQSMTSFSSTWVNSAVSDTYSEEQSWWNVPMACFLHQVSCVGMVIIHLKAMLISCSVPRILMCRAPQITNTLFWIAKIYPKCAIILIESPTSHTALSASSLKIQSTGEGFKLYCSLKYYISFLKTSWYFKWVHKENTSLI